MADSADLGAFARKMDQLAAEFEGRKLAEALKRVGVGAKADAGEAVRRDLGDDSMSNWPRRGRTQPIRTRFDVQGDSVVEVRPAGGSSAGGWRILEDGRRESSKGDVAEFASRSGKVRRRRVKRNSGATAGKNTWSEAVEIMRRRTPGRVRESVVIPALKRLF